MDREMLKRGIVSLLMVCGLVLILGCNPKLGLIVFDTRPPGAEVYLNEQKVGETPLTFEFDMDKPVTLRLLKEGYQPREEKINVYWVKSEFYLGNYQKGDYVVQGNKQKAFQVHTTRELVPR